MYGVKPNREIQSRLLTFLPYFIIDVPERIKMMGHSDHKLTDKIYTGFYLLQTGEVIRNLPDDKILTEISGKSGLNELSQNRA